MKLWRKPPQPLDRAVQELDDKIAQLERQRRRLEASPGPPTVVVGEKVGAFVKTMLQPTASSVPATYHARRDLFDVETTPLKDLEAEPVAFGPRTVAPDLFAGTATGVAARPAAAGQKEEKLVRYLGAGSIRTYKPTKSIQRRDRNRFLTWIGLAVAALWLLYVVVR